jgi:hypothetical protein
VQNNRFEPVLGGVFIAMSEYLGDFLYGNTDWYQIATRALLTLSPTDANALFAANQEWESEMWSWILDCDDRDSGDEEVERSKYSKYAVNQIVHNWVETPLIGSSMETVRHALNRATNNTIILDELFLIDDVLGEIRGCLRHMGSIETQDFITRMFDVWL